MRDWVDGYGVAGPLVFIAVSASLTVVLFPGPVLAGASGLLFGTALGTPVSIASATLGGDAGLLDLALVGPRRRRRRSPARGCARCASGSAGAAS